MYEIENVKQIPTLYEITFVYMSAIFGNFKSSDWLTQFMKVILIGFSLIRISLGTPNLHCGRVDVGGCMDQVTCTCHRRSISNSFTYW